MDLLQVMQDAITGNRPTLVMAVLSQPDYNVNAADKNGNTALMLAVRSGNPDMVEIIMMGGANLNAVDKDGLTALMWAEKLEARRIADMLRARGAWR